MKLFEMFKTARAWKDACEITGSKDSSSAQLATGVLDLFATPPECSWPIPEVFVDGEGKYAVWESLGLSPISAVELRSIIAMLGRALAEIES